MKYVDPSGYKYLEYIDPEFGGEGQLRWNDPLPVGRYGAAESNFQLMNRLSDGKRTHGEWLERHGYIYVENQDGVGAWFSPENYLQGSSAVNWINNQGTVNGIFYVGRGSGLDGGIMVNESGNLNVYRLEDGTVVALPMSVACSQGGGNDVANLFGKYNAGYIADENSSQIFPNQSFDKDKLITRYMVEGVGVWIVGMVNSGAGTVGGGLAITVQGQEHLVKMKSENYLQNGQGMGIYAINVNAPGAFPRAMLFNAVDGSSIGWHYTTVKGAPTMQYHIYLKFLRELNNVR